ncbi:hypothetical protein WA026_015558 [Henosepilachna vigintioctopunctata]|uniref:Tudor domain-containing protein n=1 Tax=Henosepilachna vigintioctopunctata TaxID=420089 RepID=A0AAW1VDE6_9CUCU
MNTNHSTEDSQVKRITKIENIFNFWQWKFDDTRTIFMANIYDPSKFWVRLFPIKPFEKHLTEFYQLNKMSLCVKSSDICIGLNCVARISDVYRRSRIVGIDTQNEITVKIFLYDHGKLVITPLSNIFHLDQSFYKIPAFAVRAMLTNISSLDHGMWNQNVVDKFVKYTEDKPLLAKIAHVHKQNKIIEIHLIDRSYQNGSGIITINYFLLRDGLAKLNNQHPVNNTSEKSEYKPLKERLYLYPTFDALENGIVPSRVDIKEELQRHIRLDVLYPDLYKFHQSVAEYVFM